MLVGSQGFVAWLYAIIYVNIRNACKNILVKIFVHLIGLILILLGLYFFLTTIIPSAISLAGIILIFLGLFIFLIPMGIDE